MPGLHGGTLISVSTKPATKASSPACARSMQSSSSPPHARPSSGRHGVFAIPLQRMNVSPQPWRSSMRTSARTPPKMPRVVLFVLALPWTSVAADDSGDIKMPCAVDGKEVEVTVRAIPGIPQRCFEVSYYRQRAYICVAASGTPDRPYSFTLGKFDPEWVTKDGWTGGGNYGHTAYSAFRGACSATIRRHEEEQAKLGFDPHQAAQDLEKYFDWQLDR